MTKQEQILKDNIMRRVMFIYGVKRLPSVFLPKLAILSTLVAFTGFFVSVPNVFRNMPNILDVQKFFAFSTSAFLNTRLTIQIISLGALVMFFYMLRDLFKVLLSRTHAVSQIV